MESFIRECERWELVSKKSKEQGMLLLVRGCLVSDVTSRKARDSDIVTRNAQQQCFLMFVRVLSVQKVKAREL